MASGTLAEANTTPSGSFIENLFLNLPTDARFKQVITHKFVPRTGLDENSTQIEFVLPALDAPNCYFISNVMIEATVLITKEDNTLPAATDKVAPIPNMLSSLFETVSLRINDNLITASGSQYAFKDFLQTLLSSTADAKQLLTCKVICCFNFASQVIINKLIMFS
jgi:hypothetical protein